MRNVSVKDQREDSERQREEGHAKKEAEVRVKPKTLFETKEYQ